MVPFFRAFRAEKEARSRSNPYLGVGYPSICQFSAIEWPQMLPESDETWKEVCSGIARQRGVVGFVIFHQGAELFSAQGENMAVLAFFGDFMAMEGQNEWSRAPQSMCRYSGECWGSCLRHFPTASVCNQCLGVCLRLLPTAGVCDQHSRVCTLDFCPPQVYVTSMHMCC